MSLLSRPWTQQPLRDVPADAKFLYNEDSVIKDKKGEYSVFTNLCRCFSLTFQVIFARHFLLNASVEISEGFVQRIYIGQYSWFTASFSLFILVSTFDLLLYVTYSCCLILSIYCTMWRIHVGQYSRFTTLHSVIILVDTFEWLLYVAHLYWLMLSIYSLCSVFILVSTLGLLLYVSYLCWPIHSIHRLKNTNTCTISVMNPSRTRTYASLLLL